MLEFPESDVFTALGRIHTQRNWCFSAVEGPHLERAAYDWGAPLSDIARLGRDEHSGREEGGSEALEEHGRGTAWGPNTEIGSCMSLYT